MDSSLFTLHSSLTISLFTFLGCVLVDDFVGQSQMVFRSCRVGIVEYDGESVPWPLAEIRVATDYGLEN